MDSSKCTFYWMLLSLLPLEAPYKILNITSILIWYLQVFIFGWWNINCTSTFSGLMNCFSMCRTQVTKVPMKLWYKRTDKQSGQNLEEFFIETSTEEASLEVHSLVKFHLQSGIKWCKAFSLTTNDWTYNWRHLFEIHYGKKGTLWKITSFVFLSAVQCVANLCWSKMNYY
jgi:hypothetical protein